MLKPSFNTFGLFATLNLGLAIISFSIGDFLVYMGLAAIVVSTVLVLGMYGLDQPATETYVQRIGGALIVVGISMGILGFKSVGTCWGCVLGGLFLNYWGWRFRYLRQNYAWYVGTHPGVIRGGRLHCYSCGGGRVHTERMMRRQFLRRHFCAQCGDTLYFSRE
ncbi:hypothetical protein [Hydrocarboniphaga effusa]|uniref:hypothetical protein n=1 Tax=Hydrocarboniphaga effusa TaxID=243629 RepID=UPI003BA98494